MISHDPPRWTVAELGDFLVAPDAGEQLAPLASAAANAGTNSGTKAGTTGERSYGERGPGALVLDLEGSSAHSLERFEARLLAQLPILPCVTIAVDSAGRDASPIARSLAETCDVVVTSHEEVEPLLAGFAACPVAALAFVQLLRDAPRRSVYAGLVAESFVYSTLQSGAEFQRWLAARRPRRVPLVRRVFGAAEEPAVCRIERDRGRLDVRLTRAHKHNAFSRAMRDGLVEALQLALADPSIEEVVLSGEGPSFCSGGDLDEFGSFPDPAEAHAIRTTRSPALLLARLGDRVRVEVQGACIGAGAELPAFTACVVAQEDAFFQLPEVGLGLVPGAGGTASLPRRIGRQRTAWLGLSGTRIDAQTALDWGLVDEVRLGQHVRRERDDRN